MVATSAVLLTAGDSASAAVPERQLDDARAIALRVWDGEPCSEPVRIRLWRMRRDTLGIARWDGMWDIPPEQREGCTVVLNSRRTYTWRVLCTTIVHEFGHLGGHDHSERRHASMAASYSGPYRACVRSRAARRWDD